MKTLDDMQQLRQKILAELDEIDQKIDERKSETLVQCETNHAYVGSGCGMGFKIKELTYIQTHWYTPPRGCSDGDYWNQGEGQFNCPACGYRNRLYNRPDIEKLKKLFGNIVEEHDD